MSGYHSEKELYLHRYMLYLAFVKMMPHLAWISLEHDDGTMFKDSFVLGMELPTGTITYHLPLSWMQLAMETGATVLERAPKWDGHSSNDVLQRLELFIQSRNET
jgi:hypothetical protein